MSNVCVEVIGIELFLCSLIFIVIFLTPKNVGFFFSQSTNHRFVEHSLRKDRLYHDSHDKYLTAIMSVSCHSKS